MPRTDLPLDELPDYTAAATAPADFDDFWAATLAEAARYDQPAVAIPHRSRLTTLDVFDVSFPGFGGHPVKAWLLLPRRRSGRLPCVVRFPGYGGGRGSPLRALEYASCGYADLVMDVRGQGTNTAATGDTPDAEYSPHPHRPGFMTKGVLDPRHYYYRRVITDAVRAVAAARTFDSVDPDRVAVAGASQGGGLAVAAAALAPDVAAVVADVPFLSHFRRATEIASAGPYLEIAEYLAAHRDSADRVFATLAYADALNFASRASAPASFSAAGMDPITPPSTCYAVYNAYAGPKRMRLWEFNGHEAGDAFGSAENLGFLAEHLG
ncbi:acetylxylan esterase [Streptomonospora litoralis]|uniref:Cephalosporin-C deacetylase n=1 Tax=Streptomonospora litoralis TaxID=2498135 RepID=A0A4P6Q3K7_9ACTN|nr:alpha/beta fold hydrolase [Streptomonospora litoralis]QBI53394.1 Cephalosporin-C deacetylase [Streptomonospora litoralis]